MRQFEFICRGIEAPAVEQDVSRVEMDVQGNRTVNLRISDISQHHSEKVARRIRAFLDWADKAGSTSGMATLRQIAARYS